MPRRKGVVCRAGEGGTSSQDKAMWLLCSEPGGDRNEIREVAEGLVTRLGFILRGPWRVLNRETCLERIPW